MPGLSSYLATCCEVREGEEEVPLFHQVNLEEIAVQWPVVIGGTDCGSPWWNGLSFLLHRFVPDWSWRSNDTLFTSGLSNNSLSFFRKTNPDTARQRGSLQGREGGGEGPAATSRSPPHPVILQSPGQGSSCFRLSTVSSWGWGRP